MTVFADNRANNFFHIMGIQADRKASTSANCLNSIALPSITGAAAYGQMSPSPSNAVPSVTTATVFRLMVSEYAVFGFS
jgi:hypothetical protein